MSRIPAGYLRKSHRPRSCSLKVVEARLREWQEPASKHLTEFSGGALLIGKQNQEIALALATDLKSLAAGLSGCELSEIFERPGNWLNGEFPREWRWNSIRRHVRRISKMTVIRKHSWRFWSPREGRLAVKITFRRNAYIFLLLFSRFYRKSIFKLRDSDVLHIRITRGDEFFISAKISR